MSNQEKKQRQIFINGEGELTGGEENEASTETPQAAARTFEKSKRQTQLESEITAILQNGGEKAALLENFTEEIKNYFELNTTLQQSKKELVGCRWALDLVYYGPAVAFLLSELSSGKISGDDLGAAAIISAICGGFVLMINGTITSDNKSKPKQDQVDPSWVMYRDMKKEIKTITQELKEKEKLLRTYISLLGLNQTKEVQKSRSFSDTLVKIQEQYRDYARTQEVLDKARKRIS